MGYLRNGECYSFQSFAIGYSTPENLQVGISGALGMTEATFSTKMCFEKCCGVSQKWWLLQLSILYHCIQQPWKPASRDFWSSMNKRKPLSQQKCVLKKCCGVSQKWWMLQLSILCHWVQHPYKLPSRDFWSSSNNRKPLSQQKCVLRKCCRVSQKWCILELCNFAIVFCSQKTY